MPKNTHFSAEFHEETLKRIGELEAPGYVFPPKFNSLDWVLAVICIIASGVLLLAGAGM